MELARSAGIRVEEGAYYWEQLKIADEVFLTNSVQEIVPVTTLWEKDKKFTVGDGLCGRMTSDLISFYRERMGIPK